MRIAITGSRGFIGKNLKLRLTEVGYTNLILIDHDSNDVELDNMLADVDFVFHLAGVNRPKKQEEFKHGNLDFTSKLCASLERVAKNKKAPNVAYASSAQAILDTPYGVSKREAENTLQKYALNTGSSVYIFRLTNVFGKWSRPNYNSVVATFCYNIAHGLPIAVHDSTSKLRLIYIDDVVNNFILLLENFYQKSCFVTATPEYETTVGELAALVQSFKTSRKTLMTERVGIGLVRAIYATYVSFLPIENFQYDVQRHSDSRGVFVEMLKTPDCGQFSYFTALPGVTRGEHYHHSKTEKFLVIRGRALFGFRHMSTGTVHKITVEGGQGCIVETVPGWTHSVSNIGNEEMIVMLWANEIFDPGRPDTQAEKVNL